MSAGDNLPADTSWKKKLLAGIPFFAAGFALAVLIEILF